MNNTKQSEEKLTINSETAPNKASVRAQVSKPSTNHLRLRRYSSRRLYARGWVSYVTIADLASFIRTGGTIEASCAKTRLDVTEKVLKQVQAHITLEADVTDRSSLYANIRKGGAA